MRIIVAILTLLQGVVASKEIMDEEQALFLEYGIAAGGTIVFTIAVGVYFLQEQQTKIVEFESFDSSRDIPSDTKRFSTMANMIELPPIIEQGSAEEGTMPSSVNAAKL